VLAALKAPEEIAENMVLGQYEGYRQEPSVKEDSVTETYAAVRLFIDNDRWKGMPFYIRTGKKLGKREMQVAVVFKSPLPGLEPNILNIKIQSICSSISRSRESRTIPSRRRWTSARAACRSIR